MTQTTTLDLMQVAQAIGDSTRRPRGWVLLGAPHQGQGRNLRFDGKALVAWCETGARDAEAARDLDAAAAWSGYADRLRGVA